MLSDTDALAALKEGSRGTWASPLTGVSYTYRRLSKADLIGCPEALPIFDLASGMALAAMARAEDETPLERELAKRSLARHEQRIDDMDEHEAKITRHLICSGMVSPRVLPDPDDYTTDAPDGAVFYHQIPEADRVYLMERIRTLMAGLDALERRLAAARAVSFRGERAGEADSPNGNGAVGSVGADAPDPGASVGSDGEARGSARQHASASEGGEGP